MTNHHPKCEHVDASLIDVWRVNVPGESGGLIVDSEAAAIDAARDETGEEPLEITKEKMHREIYENLPEFGGF